MASSAKNPLGLGCLTVALLPFFAAGAGMMGYGAYLAGRGYAAKSWPIVEGVVTHSGTRTETGSKGKKRTTHADIRYAYAWRERKLEGKKIRLGDDYMTVNGKASGLAEDLRNYPVGKTVRVRVDPDHPEKAVLEPGVAFVPVLLLLVFGAVFGGMASLFLFLAIRQARKKRKAVPASDAIDFDGARKRPERGPDRVRPLQKT